MANLPAKKLHRKPHHRSRNRYRNTPPLNKKIIDHSDAAMATPKSNNSGVATPTTTAAVIGGNDSSMDKSSDSRAVSSKIIITYLLNYQINSANIM